MPAVIGMQWAGRLTRPNAAGIDAFLVAWYGPGGGPNQTETNLAAMLDEAAARDFRIGILFETDSPFFAGVGDVTSALQHIQTVHANHPAICAPMDVPSFSFGVHLSTVSIPGALFGHRAIQATRIYGLPRALTPNSWPYLMDITCTATHGIHLQISMRSIRNSPIRWLQQESDLAPISCGWQR